MAIKLSERTHPLYDENLDLWNLYFSAAKGGENFITDVNLFSHRLEESTDFNERLERAYFLNFCDTIPSLINSFIFKENIERPTTDNEILSYFRTDVNNRGLSITDFVKRAGYFASVFGVVHALITTPSSPTGKTLTKAQVRDLGIRPKATLVYPSQLVDWSLDSEGAYNWVIIKSIYYRDTDPTKEREEEEHYKIITREKWWVEDEDGNKIKYEDGRDSQGINTLGLVPMATLYHKNIDDNKIGESILKDIVYINRSILNWCSCVDEQIERQTFSQLVVPDDGTLANEDEAGEDPLHQIGTSSIWTFPGDANHPPNFISPNVENINTVWKLVVDHIKEIYRLAGLVGSSEDMFASRSGRQSQYGFVSVNSSLTDKSYSYQVFENEISKLVYLLSGEDIENYKEVKYPTSFDVTALADELDSNIKIMERNFSPSLNKQLQKNIARRSIPTATNEVMKEVETEIDKGDGIVEPLKTIGNPIDKSADSGNPNTKLGDSFTTNNDKIKKETSKRSNEDLNK